MTYLVYTVWILVLVLLAGQIDALVSNRLIKRYGPVPEVHWTIPVFTTAMMPGVGQFLNGEPVKAVFVFLWPLLTVARTPIPPPWQMWLIKTPALLLPWWIVTVGDGLVVGLVRWRRRKGELTRQAEEARTSHRTVELAEYLARRRSTGPGKEP